MEYSKFVDVEEDSQYQQMTLNYPFFDGRKVVENAAVVVKDGVITEIKESDVCEDGFLIPGFLDAHTHMNTSKQVNAMLRNGIVATCDVAAYDSLIQQAYPFTIVSSAGMTMGTLNGKAYVKKAIEAGAKYIKVLLMEPNLMLKSVLKDICNTAHENGLKVAVHAVSLKSVRLSVECGVDILLHVPMKEEFPMELAKTIAEKSIAVAPTLIMMEAFANSGRNGYKPEHYRNAERVVKLLHESGVTILAATDANPGSFSPEVPYGTSLHREMKLLVQAGMTSIQVLESATSKIAEVFEIETLGTIEEGKSAALLLVDGRPDKNIADTKKIKQIWIDGKPIL